VAGQAALPYTGGMDRLAVRRWVMSRRAAEAREREENRRAPDGAAAVRFALALIALDGRLHGWPREEDLVSQREDELARARWARLRTAWRHR